MRPLELDGTCTSCNPLRIWQTRTCSQEWSLLRPPPRSSLKCDPFGHLGLLCLLLQKEIPRFCAIDRVLRNIKMAYTHKSVPTTTWQNNSFCGKSRWMYRRECTRRQWNLNKTEYGEENLEIALKMLITGWHLSLLIVRCQCHLLYLGYTNQVEEWKKNMDALF